MEKEQERSELLRDLRENYKREMEGATLYRQLASAEKDEVRKRLLLKMAEAEKQHAARWAAQIEQMGGQLPEKGLGRYGRWQLWLARWLGTETAIRRQEAAEDRDIGIYGRQRQRYSQQVGDVLEEVERDERRHSRYLKALKEEGGPQAALDAIFGRERWHRRGHNWVGDAIYGANDGLGAVFGVVSGVAGYTNISRWVLVSGLAGTIASALSMAAGAYLATKASAELSQTELAHEQCEVEEHPEEEREELELIYQLKGFSEEEARLLVGRLSERPDQFMKTMVSEESGISEVNVASPLRSALSAGLSTAVGAIIPVLPFFWLDGVSAIVVAGAVSLVAHFAVGAAKSLITLRSWWASGLEMMGVGAVEGGVTYGLGLLAGRLL
jgi:VIT1/CCC1 family predicted Fe2+/Mn2+ transporter/rubrerythrin